MSAPLPPLQQVDLQIAQGAHDARQRAEASTSPEQRGVWEAIERVLTLGRDRPLPAVPA